MYRRTTNITFRFAFQLAFIYVLMLSQPVFAADISRDVRFGREDETIEHDWYLEISASAILNQMPIPRSDTFVGRVGIGGHYRYKRFFVDAHAESYNQFQFGLNAYAGDVWSFDVLGVNSEHGVDSELNSELEELTAREEASYLGVRATGYSGPYIFQFEALKDVSNVHSGALLTATAARQWLYRNWNFHALIGARYESAEALDYQFGIDADEASEIYPVYEAGAGTTFVTEAGITYPLNEHFVLKATGRWWELPSATVGSPFITDDSYLTFSTSITFVY